MFHSPTWKNITISGRAASGATTLSRSLAHTIQWELINGGEMYRLYAKEHNIPLEHTTRSSDSYHRELDEFIKEKLTSSAHLIIESWLSGFDARGIDGVYKIFVHCPDDGIRIDRLVNREGMTVDQAKYHLKTREEENLKKWEQLYHTRDIWNPHLYDLVIDTYANGPAETLQLALKGIGYSND